MEKKVVSTVRKDSNGQRRITIPVKDKTLNEGDVVEIKKINLK